MYSSTCTSTTYCISYITPPRPQSFHNVIYIYDDDDVTSYHASHNLINYHDDLMMMTMPHRIVGGRREASFAGGAARVHTGGGAGVPGVWCRKGSVLGPTLPNEGRLPYVQLPPGYGRLRLEPEVVPQR